MSVNQGLTTNRLSGARLLFGYVADNREGESSQTKGLGEGNESRLAGRIAINCAVEYLKQPKTLAERFVKRSGTTQRRDDDLQCFNIPLPPLGTPKASAVEHYVDQSTLDLPANAATITYGDLPGVLPSQAHLNGRKFYRHISTKPSTNEPFQSNSSGYSKQATLARFISQPGSEFRFTLRFKDLRDWELGAVLVALQPDLLRQFSDGETSLPKDVNALLQQQSVKNAGSQPAFALKLGYARPLGLGSVAITTERLRTLDNTGQLLETTCPGDDWQSPFVKSFMQVAQDKCLPFAQWLKVCVYPGNGIDAEYPKGKNQEIFNYHTAIRRAHSEMRRLRKPYGNYRYDTPVKS